MTLWTIVYRIKDAPVAWSEGAYIATKRPSTTPRVVRALFPTIGPQDIPARIANRLHHEPNTGCLLWEGALNEKGYAIVWWQGRKVRLNRLLWKLRTGRWPRKDREICHKCDTRPCAEETHHFEGTTRQNARDRHAKGRTRGAIDQSQKSTEGA